ncbi:hypothetical protein GCM10010965_29830 [Caldalkalibacillus thermarum]|uniref:Flp family type IVb pilin n=1 Tax=Caldalkalibacillus thermarum TaxID=296745 RepID=UPI0016681D64|nr:hypothetical protein [Caldalkalibacillus thermarum]GGK34927.1 hypothetical protein GCM10010965_29830 [Caldalkalibacillus thermarum]
MVERIYKSLMVFLVMLGTLNLRLRKQEGQTWMEYGMIIGGAILVIVLVMVLFGDRIMAMFSDINNAIKVRQPNQGW